MAKKTYVSVGSKAKLTRKWYCSVGGKAKLVKRVYASVGGKAKLVYDTAVITYIKDNSYTNNTTVYKTERIAIGSKATKVDSLHWYKSDGTEWNFNSAVTGNMTLYEAVYTDISTVTFDGSHYVPTDYYPSSRNDRDFRTQCFCSAATDTTERVVFGCYGSPMIVFVKNPSKQWSGSLGNNTSSPNYNQGALVAVKQNETCDLRMNLTSNNHYMQIWTDSNRPSNGNYKGVFEVTQSGSTKRFCIGWVEGAPSHWLPFVGKISYVSTTNVRFNPKKRIKGGTTVNGFARNDTNKFYPLVSSS